MTPTSTDTYPDRNDYAFPSPSMSFALGLTIRAHFASLAMQGFCSNPSIVDTKGGAVWIATESLRVADALMAELNKTL